MISHARILRAFENLEIGFANLAKNAKMDGKIQHGGYLQVVVFEEVDKLRELLKKEGMQKW